VLHVGPSAKVQINDRPTTSTGSERTYLSWLEPGKRYLFRIEVTEHGEVIRRDIVLQPGDTKTLQVQGSVLASL